MRIHDLTALIAPFALLTALATGVIVTTHRNAQAAPSATATHQVVDLPGMVITARPTTPVQQLTAPAFDTFQPQAGRIVARPGTRITARQAG